STLSRRISGTNDLLALLLARAEGPALSLERVGAVSGAAPSAAGSDAAKAVGAAGGEGTAALEVWPAATCFRSSAFSDQPGNLHFPSAFCGQITLGSTSDTSLITKRREKSDRNLMRSRKVFALRKFVAPMAGTCGMVMPLSLRPRHA